MPKPGRKALGAERLQALIAFRVSKAQKKKLETAAKSQGLQLSEWLRTVALNAAN